MMKRLYETTLLLLLSTVMVSGLSAQRRPDLTGRITDEAQALRIAVPDVPGPGDLRREVSVFNNTLWNDLESSAYFEMISKSFYPRTPPRRPEDLNPDENAMPADPGARGFWLRGWSDAPVTARYLTFGSLQVRDERLVLSGYLYDALADALPNAHIFGKRYFSSSDQAGARQLAHEFARDILMNLGLGPGLAGSRIYFVSNRTGHKEIWVMDYDGSNQRPVTRYENLSLTPAVSPDGNLLAFTTYVDGLPKIYVHSLETARRLTFYNQQASLNTTPSFGPDGKTMMFASTAVGRSQIYSADLDGRNFRRISYSRSIDVDPAINPKTGAQVAFVSGRSGIPQVYLMDADGANVQMLSLGGGDAVQPSWDPQGENIAFAWTRGFEPGNYNIFVLNVATRDLVQLTYGAGRNEAPYWSPSGTHIVYSSDRLGSTQLWTMRADGTDLKRLTTAGANESPVWAVK
jgi:TolB protein